MISTKTCSKCKIEQPLSNFSKNCCMKDGLCNWCKECVNEGQRKYYLRNKEKISSKHREYNEKNKSKIKEIQANWYEKNKDKQREKHRKYYIDNIERKRLHNKKYNSSPEIKAHRLQYRKNNAEHIREYHREYRRKNIAHIREQQREYYHRNKDKTKIWRDRYKNSHREQIKESAKKYREENKEKINKNHIKRLHSDPFYKMKEQTRNMIRCAFRAKGHRKTSRTADIVGCDLDFLCEYLFKTWEKNYGAQWNGEPYHIDHIIPLATAKTEEDIKKLCHYTNLQMLTPKDNMEKGDRM